MVVLKELVKRNKLAFLQVASVAIIFGVLYLIISGSPSWTPVNAQNPESEQPFDVSAFLQQQKGWNCTRIFDELYDNYTYVLEVQSKSPACEKYGLSACEMARGAEYGKQFLGTIENGDLKAVTIMRSLGATVRIEYVLDAVTHTCKTMSVDNEFSQDAGSQIQLPSTPEANPLLENPQFQVPSQKREMPCVGQTPSMFHYLCEEDFEEIGEETVELAWETVDAKIMESETLNITLWVSEDYSVPVKFRFNQTAKGLLTEYSPKVRT